MPTPSFYVVAGWRVNASLTRPAGIAASSLNHGTISWSQLGHNKVDLLVTSRKRPSSAQGLTRSTEPTLPPSQPRTTTKRLSLVALFALVLTQVSLPSTAFATDWASGLRPLWVGIGGAGGGAIGTSDGAGYASLTVGLRLIPVVPEVTIREGFSGRGSTLLHHHGNIALGARVLLPGLAGLRPNVRLGFSHRHDAPIEVFKAKPLAVIFGTGEGITHRSGIETGGGLELSVGPKKVVGLWFQGTVVVLPSPDLVPVTGLIEGGVSFALGPPRP